MQKKEFQQTRIDIGICQSIRTIHADKFARLREMFSRHPTVGEGIIDLRAQRNPVWGGIDYVAVYESCESVISANDCFYVKLNRGAHDLRKVKRAARSTIRSQIDSFRNNTPCQCGSTYKLQVDHIRHFDDLITTFLNSRLPTEFDYTEGSEPVFQEPLATEWNDYHRSNATLRMMCAKCNVSRPKWVH
jgi:hypothetical protein